MRSIVEMGASVPAFLAKLWRLVEDPETDHLISWSPGGKMFSIQNQAEFARELLPLYYKHNNMASFIRQLNMYGFHKITSVENGGLKSEKDEIEFGHPCFLQEHPYLLEHIKRKIAHPRSQVQNISEDKSLLKPEMMNKVLVDVKQIKGKQESLDAKFSAMKHENEALWREVAFLRQKHNKQQQIVNNLIQFLMSLVQPSRGGTLKTGGVKRRYQLMINNAAHNGDSTKQAKSPRLGSDHEYTLSDLQDEEENGPIIHEVESLADSDSVRNILLCSDPDARSSVSPDSAAMPPFSATSPGEQDYNADMEYSTFETLGEMDAPLSVRPSDILNEDIENTNKESENASPSFSVPVTSTKPTATLPRNIFDGEETNSQDSSNISLNEMQQHAALSALQDASRQICAEPTGLTSEEFLNSMTSGTYNTSLNLNQTVPTTSTKGKMKRKGEDVSLIGNIKEEILNPEEEDSSNMALATRPTLQRFKSVEEVDGHLDAMQADLDSIKQILRGENYSLDANALLSSQVLEALINQETCHPSSLGISNRLLGSSSRQLFTGAEEPLYNLPPLNPLEKQKESSDDSAGQLISYTSPSPLFDFDDIQLDEADSLQSPSDDIPLPIEETSSSLNTPQMSLTPPDFSAKK